MSLSNNYNLYNYFDDAVIFLKEYEWILNYPNTHVLVQGVLKRIPEDWKGYFERFGFVNLRNIASLQVIKDDCPQSFEIFLNKIRHLSSTSSLCEIKQSECNLSRICGLTKKKKHEIESLAPVVAEICEQTDSKNVIDVGAGLGYLSYLMAEKYNFSILAIEGSIKKIELALINELQFHQNSKHEVLFHHHFITEESFDEMRETIEKNMSKTDKICICGLHACADLSAVILDLFLKLKHVKSLVIMPCCYHRLSLEKVIGGEEYFKNFPLSDALKSVFEKHNATSFLRRPFLRLACQKTINSFINLSEEVHLLNAEHLMSRAVLQQAAEELGCDVLRLKRKTGKCGEVKDIFNFRLNNLVNTHRLISRDKRVNPPEIGGTIFKEKMLSIWEIEKENLILFAALTTLQNAIQNICENIILQDRVQFMKEKGVNCYIKKITDDTMSPRCHALIAIKD